MKQALSLVLLVCVSVALAGQDRVAVRTLDAGSGVADQDMPVITELLESELIGGAYALVPREDIDFQLTQSAGLAIVGCNTAECAATLGALVEADTVVFGAVRKFGSKFYVTVSAVDVESVEVVFSENAEAASYDDIPLAIRSLAESFTGGAPDAAAQASEPSNARETSTADPPGDSMGSFAVLVNPLGFAQFGPIVNVEIGVRPNSYLYLQLRLSALGVLTYVVGEYEEVSLSSIGIGGGLRYFVPSNDPGRWYVGGGIEYYSESGKGDVGESYEWEGNYSYFIFGVNTGYRWRFSGFFVNVGLMGGYAAGLSGEWHYTDVSYYDDGESDDAGSQPYGMLEVSIGWEI